MSCPTVGDQAFGPRVSTDCRSFDFTLQFEDVVFACVPSAIFVLLAPSRIAHLVRQPAAFPIHSRLFASKLVRLAALSIDSFPRFELNRIFRSLRRHSLPFNRLIWRCAARTPHFKLLRSLPQTFWPSSLRLHCLFCLF